MPRIIKTEREYSEALAELVGLLEAAPEPNSSKGEELALLALVVRDYESKIVSTDLPTAVDAIRFRMEQQGLTPRDLIPYIGSRSRVSEVLSGKRALTLAMMRRLHEGLGIPAAALLQGRDSTALKGESLDWKKFPYREMLKRGWFRAFGSDSQHSPEEVLRTFFAPLGSPATVTAFLRRTFHVRSTHSVNRHAIVAWTARVLLRSLEYTDLPKAPRVNADFMHEVVRLSWADNGPALAREFLLKQGIPLVIEPHFPSTYLDGAAIRNPKGRAVIGLTLRHDRLDNFWFCLLHELAHFALHEDDMGDFFLDDLDQAPQESAAEYASERDADRLAGEVLIPSAAWRTSPASRLRSPEAAQHLAGILRIHPAIVAGRIRHEFRSFRVLKSLVGYGEVRRCFPDVTWQDEASA